MATGRKRGRNRRDQKTGDPLPPSGMDPLTTAPDSQAKRVILRFGGVKNLIVYMLRGGIRRTPMSVYHWVYHGGLIPPNGIRDVFLAEIQAGIQLTDADWSPYTVVEEPKAPEVLPQTFETADGASVRKRRRVL